MTDTTENKEPIEGEVIDNPAAQVSDLKELVFVVKGQIVESNLAEVAQQISANIDAIPEELESEDDFNNAEKVAKQLREAKNQLAERRDKALQDAEELYAELQLIGEVEEKCVNPSHLFLGTRLQNMQDCVEKNRQAKGWKLPQTKVSENDKKIIVKMAKSGFPYSEIANQFNITPQNAGKIAIAHGVRRK